MYVDAKLTNFDTISTLTKPIMTITRSYQPWFIVWLSSRQMTHFTHSGLQWNLIHFDWRVLQAFNVRHNLCGCWVESATVASAWAGVDVLCLSFSLVVNAVVVKWQMKNAFLARGYARRNRTHALSLSPAEMSKVEALREARLGEVRWGAGWHSCATTQLEMYPHIVSVTCVGFRSSCSLRVHRVRLQGC